MSFFGAPNKLTIFKPNGGLDILNFSCVKIQALKILGSKMFLAKVVQFNAPNFPYLHRNLFLYNGSSAIFKPNGDNLGFSCVKYRL